MLNNCSAQSYNSVTSPSQHCQNNLPRVMAARISQRHASRLAAISTHPQNDSRLFPSAISPRSPTLSRFLSDNHLESLGFLTRVERSRRNCAGSNQYVVSSVAGCRRLPRRECRFSAPFLPTSESVSTFFRIPRVSARVLCGMWDGYSPGSAGWRG